MGWTVFYFLYLMSPFDMWVADVLGIFHGVTISWQQALNKSRLSNLLLEEVLYILEIMQLFSLDQREGGGTHNL